MLIETERGDFINFDNFLSLKKDQVKQFPKDLGFELMTPEKIEDAFKTFYRISAQYEKEIHVIFQTESEESRDESFKELITLISLNTFKTIYKSEYLKEEKWILINL